MRALADVMGAGVFGANSRQPRLLRYLVQSELEGDGERLKAYAIATEALGRGEDFDPTTDSIVRVEVNRLRQSLAHYYATEGADARLIIEIPKGQYRPTFTMSPAEPELDRGPVPESTSGGIATPHRRPFWIWLLAGACGFAVVAVSVLVFMRGDDESGAPADPTLSAQGSETDVQPGDETATQYTSVGRRPSFPRIFTKASSDAQVVELILLAVQNVASRFESARVITGAPARATGAVWPEDYQIEVTALPGEDGVSVFLRLVHLQSGELVDSREVRVSGLELDALDLENRLAVQRATARFVSIDGVVGQDYRRRGDYSPTMRCALLMQDFLADRSDTTLQEARQCAQAEIGGGNREPYLFATLAFLQLQTRSYGIGGTVDSDGPAAVRLARSAVNRAPNSAAAALAQMLALEYTGDREGAELSGNRAVELNPFSSAVTGIVGLHMCHFERYRRGLELLDRSAELHGGSEPWREYGFFLAHYGLGDLDQAASHARYLGDSLDPLFLTAAIMAADIDGDHERALRLADNLRAQDPIFTADPRAALVRQGLPPTLVDAFVVGLSAAGMGDG